MHKAILIISVVLTCLLSFKLSAKPVLRVAIASNFSVTAARLIDDFESKNDINIVPLIGSTGKHAAQIQRGLAVDVFLAADKKRPQWLIEHSLAVEKSRFTYAIGRLALFSSVGDSLSNKELKSKIQGRRIAIANPRLAPYGVAAMEFLASQNVEIESNSTIIKGESVAQAFQFAASGAVELALVSYSQIKNLKNLQGGNGSYYLIPSSSHQLIEQQAVVVKPSLNADLFIRYLKTSSALDIIKNSGYEIP